MKNTSQDVKRMDDNIESIRNEIQELEFSKELMSDSEDTQIC